ncbi:MAG: hypothetical protein UZ18_ATM001001687 [Armatimonadetes bacterium OLB18]|nr:MAG: hypothetical protein UZ18_ATM001001687 [Armatimonadetes bacterium OLB18]
MTPRSHEPARQAARYSPKKRRLVPHCDEVGIERDAHEPKQRVEFVRDDVELPVDEQHRNEQRRGGRRQCRPSDIEVGHQEQVPNVSVQPAVDEFDEKVPGRNLCAAMTALPPQKEPTKKGNEVGNARSVLQFGQKL